jgi:DNA-binding GntR family transcriptional regulator
VATRHPPLAASAPRYLVVARSLLRDIERGTFKVGDLLPTELELCKRFGVSRYTAREAVRRLTDLGMVSRRAGVGTTVTASAAPSRYTARVSDLTDLFAFTRTAKLEVLSEESATIRGDLATMLPGATGQQWHRVDGVRHVNGVADPIVHVSILLRPGYEAVRDRIRERGAMIYELIEQLHGERIVELRQEISCIRCPKAIAVLLGAKPGSPALRVLRYYLGAGETLLSLAINTYPEDRFKLVTRWRLDAHGSAA